MSDERIFSSLLDLYDKLKNDYHAINSKYELLLSKFSDILTRNDIHTLKEDLIDRIETSNSDLAQLNDKLNELIEFKRLMDPIVSINRKSLEEAKENILSVLAKTKDFNDILKKLESEHAKMAPMVTFFKNFATPLNAAVSTIVILAALFGAFKAVIYIFQFFAKP